MTIDEQVFDKVELAGIYAQDGAYRTAAKLLREAALICEDHADTSDRALAEIAGQS